MDEQHFIKIKDHLGALQGLFAKLNVDEHRVITQRTKNACEIISDLAVGVNRPHNKQSHIINQLTRLTLSQDEVGLLLDSLTSYENESFLNQDDEERVQRLRIILEQAE